jgi:phage terminase large subunit-like protein
MTSALALVDELRALGPAAVERIMAKCSAEEVASLRWAYREFWLRPDSREPGSHVGTGQVPPPGDWIWWVNQGGRGSGKSTACMLAFADDAHELGPDFVGVVLCENDEEARKLIEDKKSGMRAILPPWKRPHFAPSIEGGLLTFPSGAIAHVVSAEKPSKGRGSNFNRWLIDDPPKFGPAAYGVFTALRKAFRLQGHGLRCYIATTPPGDPPPRCPELLEHLLAAQFIPDRGRDWTYSITASDDNFSNLDADVRRVNVESMAGASEDAERRGLYDPHAMTSRVFREVDFSAPHIVIRSAPPALRWVAVWIDPAVSTAGKPCEVGIVAVGQALDGRAVVLEDASGQYNAFQWPAAAIDCLERWEHFAASAHFGVETNRADAQAEALLATAVDLRRQTAIAERRPPRQLVRIIAIHTSKTKTERALLTVPYYRAGNVQHVPGLLVLEGQLRSLSDARKAGPGYDRADAVVYGLLDVFGLLDKVRPGSLLGADQAPLQVGAFGSSAQGSIVVGPEPGGGPAVLTMAAPGRVAAGAFGRSAW